MMGLTLQQQNAQPPKPKEEPFRLNLNVTLMCPECKDNPNIVEEFSSGDMVCGNCGMIPPAMIPPAILRMTDSHITGLVLSDRIVDTRSEWRTFANDENGDDPSRVGAVADSPKRLSTRYGIKRLRDCYDMVCSL